MEIGRACRRIRLQDAEADFGAICLWFRALGLSPLTHLPRLGDYPPNSLRYSLRYSLGSSLGECFVRRLADCPGRKLPGSLGRYSPRSRGKRLVLSPGGNAEGYVQGCGARCLPGYRQDSRAGSSARCFPRSPARCPAGCLHRCPADREWGVWRTRNPRWDRCCLIHGGESA